MYRNRVRSTDIRDLRTSAQLPSYDASPTTPSADREDQTSRKGLLLPQPKGNYSGSNVDPLRVERNTSSPNDMYRNRVRSTDIRDLRTSAQLPSYDASPTTPSADREDQTSRKGLLLPQPKGNYSGSNVLANRKRARCLRIEVQHGGKGAKFKNSKIFENKLAITRKISSFGIPTSPAGGVRKIEDVCTYLHDVVQELEDLLRLGVVVNDLHHQVVLDAISCDKRARSFVTRMRANNSYYGTPLPPKITFPYGQDVLQTDNSICRDTRISQSLFFTLPTDFVRCFPIDYMLAVYLGVVRRLVSIFVKGDRPVRIGPAGLNRVDRMIRNLCARVPVEFLPKCREITLYKQWKATEFRQLLFYIDPIVFKVNIPHESYHNSIDLFISVYVLFHRRFSVSRLDYARQLLL
ncbi:hypothetical protein T265_15679, partial [Opisthorchis viverrini]